MSRRRKQNKIVKIENDIVYFAINFKSAILIAQVDNSDWENVSKYSWCASSSKKRGVIYKLQSRIDNKIVSLHRFLLSPNENLVVDHKDGDVLNNTRKNLRTTSIKENNKNVKRRSDNVTGYKGVGFYKSKIRARIRVEGKLITLGFFKTLEEAAKAYNEAAIKYFGEYARLNEV